MQAASTEFVVDGVDPRVAWEGTLPVSVPLPTTTPSLPPDPSRAANPLPLSIWADASLRSLLRRDFEGVVHSEMPCTRASWARQQTWAPGPLAASEALTAGARFSSGNFLAEAVQSASPYAQ